ncbi:hypothetical protein [Vibrio nereis]|uniref:Uncharacterized protein n=1 Tax=Vibrio nereis TaxID=693 RepID=A0A0M0HUF5_VIBNE|nr:hypothetical protein [Vibrio nereis]KOO05487.1 hypothetical protein AKJ17_01455 [Vibrio nereis]
MFTIEGICDWCKKPSLLTKHEYVDGKCHHSCKECHHLAVIDVRQFNVGELQQRERQQAAR